MLKSTVFSVILFSSLFMSISRLSGQCDPLPTVSLGNDTLICKDGALLLDAGVHSGYLWSTGYTGRYISITSKGKYWVEVSNNCNDKATDTIIIAEAPDFNLSIDLPEREYFCKGEVANLVANVDLPAVIVDYSWSVSVLNTASVIIDTTRIVTLTATDQYGCQQFKTKKIEFQYPYEEDSILLATYDNEEDRYMVVYRKTDMKRTKAFILTSGLDLKDSINTTNFGNVNRIIDMETNPHLGPRLYNLLAVDSCGNKSRPNLLRVHRTSHLQITREANDYTTLAWNRYIGFQYDYFYIFKGTTATNTQIIDSVKYIKGIDAYTWTDPTKAGEIYYYQMGVKTPFAITLETGKKASSGPYVHSLSNLEDNRQFGTGINLYSLAESTFQVFPNPYKGKTIIRYQLHSDSDVSLKIFNVLGQLISEIETGRKTAGFYESGFSASESGCKPGVYYLKFEVNGKLVLTRKLIEN